MPSIWSTDELGVATEVVAVSIGPAGIPEVYSGADLVYSSSNPAQIINSSVNNLNIETFLSGQGLNPTLPVIIRLNDDIAIRSTDPSLPALTSGDLTAYTGGITLYMGVEAIISGAAGVANGGRGGDAVVMENESALTIVNEAGIIASGGGGGGKGGNGGQGESVEAWGSWRYNRDQTRFHAGNGASQWDNVSLHLGKASPYDNPWNYIVNPITNDGYIYERGDLREDEGDRKRYEIRRALKQVGVAGVGGAGGRGMGATFVTPEDGDPGTLGTNRAGNGGTGGRGGTYGLAGSPGLQGTGGLYYDNYSDAVNADGFQGFGGGNPGNAIDATNGTVTLLGAGQVLGPII